MAEDHTSSLIDTVTMIIRRELGWSERQFKRITMSHDASGNPAELYGADGKIYYRKAGGAGAELGTGGSGAYLPLAGNAGNPMTGNIVMGGNRLTDFGAMVPGGGEGISVFNSTGSRRGYLGTTDYALQCTNGGIDMGTKKITGLGAGTPGTSDAARMLDVGGGGGLWTNDLYSAWLTASRNIDVKGQAIVNIGVLHGPLGAGSGFAGSNFDGGGRVNVWAWDDATQIFNVHQQMEMNGKTITGIGRIKGDASTNFVIEASDDTGAIVDWLSCIYTLNEFWFYKPLVAYDDTCDVKLTGADLHMEGGAIYGAFNSGGNLLLYPSSHITKGDIRIFGDLDLNFNSIFGIDGITMRNDQASHIDMKGSNITDVGGITMNNATSDLDMNGSNIIDVDEMQADLATGIKINRADGVLRAQLATSANALICQGGGINMNTENIFGVGGITMNNATSHIDMTGSNITDIAALKGKLGADVAFWGSDDSTPNALVEYMRWDQSDEGLAVKRQLTLENTVGGSGWDGELYFGAKSGTQAWITYATAVPVDILQFGIGPTISITMSSTGTKIHNYLILAELSSDPTPEGTIFYKNDGHFYGVTSGGVKRLDN